MPRAIDTPAEPLGAAPATAGSTTPAVLRTNVENAVTVRVAPNALCVLGGSGLGPGEGLQIASDDQGYLTYFVTPSAAGAAVTDSISCTDDAGAVTAHRIGWVGKDDAPALGPPPPHGVRRPPLANLRATDGELLASGYPRRPDLASAPRDYERWLDFVSRPGTVATTPVMPIATRRRATAVNNDENWAGIAASQGNAVAGTFAAWNQPPVNFVTTMPWVMFDANLWVGVGGFGPGGGQLWQAGVDTESYADSARNVHTTRSPWFEMPGTAGNCGMLYFTGGAPIAVNDFVQVEVWWATNSTCTTFGFTGNNNTQYMAVELWDSTTGVTWGPVCQPLTWYINQVGCTPGPIHGSAESAEWILERTLESPSSFEPTNCLGNGQNFLPNLQNVNNTILQHTQAYVLNSGWQYASSLSSQTDCNMSNNELYLGNVCDSNTGHRLADGTVQTYSVRLNVYNQY